MAKVHWLTSPLVLLAPAPQKEQVRRQKMKSDKTKSGKKKKERDPSAPKRARTAFNFFLDEFRVEYKKTNPEAKGVVEVTQSGSAKWKVMSPEEKEPFETKALEARAKYQKDKEEYERAGGQAKFKLRQAPPRPPTAYFMFLGHFRKEFKLKNPEVKGIKDMSKEINEKIVPMLYEDLGSNMELIDRSNGKLLPGKENKAEAPAGKNDAKKQLQAAARQVIGKAKHAK